MADEKLRTERVRERALRLALHQATRLREAAHDHIVQAFGKHVHEGGPEPQDEDLRRFAKLVGNEQRLRQRYAECVVSAWRLRVEAIEPAAGGRPPVPLPALPSHQPLRPPVVAPGVPAGSRRPSRVQGVTAMALVTLAAAWAFWNGDRWRSVHPPVRADIVAAAPAPADNAIAAPARATTAALPDVTAPADASAAPPNSVPAPAAAAQPPRRSVTAVPNHKRSLVAHRADTVKARALASVRYEPDPLASCRGINFFSRAICMNNRCAQPEFKRLAQCRVVLAERHRDEARRNPTMIN